MTEVLANGAAVTETACTLICVAAPHGSERSARIFGIPGDNVDDAVNGVRSPDGAPWAAYDFNPLHIFEENILEFPVHSGIERSVHTAPVDQHQHRLGVSVSKAAYTDRPCARIDTRDLHPRHQSEKFRDTGGAGPPDVFTGENID